MSFATESPLTGPGAGGFMVVHTVGRRPRARLLRRRARDRPARGASGRSRADRRPLLEGGGPALQRRPVLVRGVRHHRSGSRGARAVRQVPLSDLCGAGARRARGLVVTPMQAYLFKILEPILAHHARVPGDLRARGPLAAGGRDHSPRGARRPAGAPWRRGTRRSSNAATAEAHHRSGARARRAADARRPRPLSGGGARAGQRALPRAAVLTNPPPSSGGT